MHEIDFLAVGEEAKTGDAIAFRFTRPDTGTSAVVIIDGGFVETGQKIVDHVLKYYGNIVDLVVCSHPDADHINGLTTVIEKLTVRRLLIHRPANYGYGADKHGANSAAVEALVTLAQKNGVIVDDQAYAGSSYFGGALLVAGPTEDFYRTQLATQSALAGNVLAQLRHNATLAKQSMLSASTDPGELTPLTDHGGTTPRNDSSIILDLLVGGKRALFTGDAGAPALDAAADVLDSYGRSTTPLVFFDVPHHGSRHNLTSDVLDRLLGAITPFNRGEAIVSVGAKADDFPRWEVANAIQRRGYRLYATRGTNVWSHTGDAPIRLDYSTPAPEVGWLRDPDAGAA